MIPINYSKINCSVLACKYYCQPVSIDNACVVTQHI